MSLLSDGPFSYNRFDEVDKIYKSMYEAKKADKDYDGDGKVESSKDEYFGSKDKAIKKAMGKDDKKKSKKDDCECKEEVELDEGKEGIQYPTGPKANFTKDKKDPKVAAGRKAAREMGLKMNEGSCGGYQKGGKVEKKDLKKEHVLDYLVQEGFVSNEVSAEVLFNHMTDDWLEHIENEIVEGFKPLPTEKMARQASKAYDKENDAVRAGNEKEVNKQMQRRIAMKNPQGQKVMLQKKNA